MFCPGSTTGRFAATESRSDRAKTTIPQGRKHDGEGTLSTLEIIPDGDGFNLEMNGTIVVRHRSAAPAFFLGHGTPDVTMVRGNFTLDDHLTERIPLRAAHLTGNQVHLCASDGELPLLTLTAAGGDLHLHCHRAAPNRFWVRLVAAPGERLWGGGEQMSYFDLAGRRFPLWTSEPGVGRDKSSPLTREADRLGNAGGDYWTTSYPQPTFLSSRHYAVHVETSAYSCLDFRDGTFHEVESWAVPSRLEFYAADRFADLVTELSTRFGRPPRLPEWAFSGAIVGLKDGVRSFARLEKMLAAGAAVTGLWCEDWAGVRLTSFGRRLFWDWKSNEPRYPELRSRIADLAARGIHFLSYVNPHLAADGSLYPEALAGGHLVLRRDADEPYLADFGEFNCGMVDLTTERTRVWFAERVIGKEMLDLGVSGWMADFGEYLPVDVRLAGGFDPLLAHNLWPVLWAEVNARAVASRGRTGDLLFFMRAGFTGSSRFCPLLWAGDQSVDFSRHDGIGTVIRGALSSGLLGNAYHHGDLGGYTSLFGNVRTPELLMRSCELCAFSPVMRSHEGNRPEENVQLDTDPVVLAHFVRMSRVHAALAPYVAAMCDEAEARGLPLQRPMFLDFEADAGCWSIETQFSYGADMLVAPVLEADKRDWNVYLPAGALWIHLWSGVCYTGGRHLTIDAPPGQPPVFYVAASAFAPLFAEIGTL